MQEEGESLIGVTHADRGPRDAFLYLLQLASLYLSAIAAVGIAWGLADQGQQSFGRTPASEIRASISVALVSFPTFLLVTRVVRRKLASGDMSARGLMRRVLTYGMLFLLTVSLVIDLIVVVFLLLGGDLTSSALIKGGVTLGVAGLTFLYYLGELREMKGAES